MAVLFYKSNTQELKENADGTFSPVTGAKLNFYEVGTTTPKDTYSDNGLTTANTNPVVSDGTTGRWSEIYLAKALYKVVATDADDVELWDIQILDGGDGTVTLFAGDAGGTANAITLTVPGVTTLETGQKFRFRAAFNNTGNTTINVNAIGAKSTRRAGGAQLTADTIKSGYSYECTYLSALDHMQLLGVDGFLSGSESVGVPANADFLFATDTSNSGASIKGSVAAFGGLKAGDIANAGLDVSVASGAITVALKTDLDADPTSDDPVRLAFRSSTLTDTTVVQRQVTGALSMVISSGSTLGFSNDEAGRIYVGAIDNAGTVELCAWRSLNGTGLYKPPENILHSTTAEGGIGGADSAAVVYSTTARSNVPLRIIGFFDITTGSTAGTWSNAPTTIQVMGPGAPRTGDRVQSVFVEDGEFVTGNTVIPFDDTIPQITEGDQYMSLAITPTSTINLLEIYSQSMFSTGVTTALSVSVFQVGVTNALATVFDPMGTNEARKMVIEKRQISGSTSALTFTTRAGPSSVVGIYFNGEQNARKFGGTLNSIMSVRELFV